MLRACIAAAADAVEAARDELGRLDAAAGDGDHGMTMALAAQAVRHALTTAPVATESELIGKAAMAMASVGGACGPIYASGLLAVAATQRSLTTDGPLTVSGLLACAEAAEAAISGLGHARPGDKTILDALDPAVHALRHARSTGMGVREALEEAASASRAGAASTAEMIATAGRASRLGERSRGFADPGATSLALIIDAVALTYAREVGADSA